MDVLYICQNYYPAVKPGGPMYSMHAAATGLAARGVVVDVATTNLDGAAGAFMNVATDRDVTIAPNYTARYFRGGRYFNWSPQYLMGLHKRILRTDVAHLQDVYSHYALWGMLLARITGKPLLISARGVFSKWALSSGKSTLKWICNRFVVGPLTRNSDVVAWHATSEQEQQDIERQFPGCVCHIVPNAMKTDLQQYPGPTSQDEYFARFAPELPYNAKTRVLVCLGRLHAIKGYDIAIEAMAALVKSDPNTILLIAGPDDGARAALEEQVKALGLQNNVAFPGHVDDPTKAMFLMGADALLCPSHSENFGMSVLEALSVGMPVVASRGTPWQSLETFGAGLWVENTVEDFVSATEQVLKHSKSWSGNARTLASRYDLSIQAQMFEKIYQQLSGKKHDALESEALTPGNSPHRRNGDADDNLLKRLIHRVATLGASDKRQYNKTVVKWRPT
jgi:glycosyltransferase involved in cell wall biosynthesis